ncbi:MAG: hypothetical protein Q8O47_02320 [Candidatus Bathyarchaeota archaeon]|nr:hypothetical protein [Candidatus Bathyarchaeota archaeon]
MQTLSAVYSEGRIVVPAQNEADSLYQDGYGTRTAPRTLTLEPCEALYLVEKDRLTVITEKDRRPTSFQQLLDNELERDVTLWIRYIVYRDIRGRGFVTKSSKDTSVSFVVYDRGSYLRKQPSYEVYTVYEGMPETIGHLEDLLRKVGESERSLKLAVVDRRGEIIYYGLDRLHFEELGPDVTE